MGIEPTSNPWQGLIITIILYLHKLVGGVGVEPTHPEGTDLQSAATLRLRRPPK